MSKTRFLAIFFLSARFPNARQCILLGKEMLFDFLIASLAEILEKVEKDDQATKSIIEFNNKISEDDRVKNIILPIRDGLNIVRKN